MQAQMHKLGLLAASKGSECHSKGEVMNQRVSQVETK